MFNTSGNSEQNQLSPRRRLRKRTAPLSGPAHVVIPQLIKSCGMQKADGEVAEGNWVERAGSGRGGYLVRDLSCKQRGDHVLNRFFVSTAAVSRQESARHEEDGEVDGEENTATSGGRTPYECDAF